ncbi:MAG: DUF4234 domain-containing protein [Pseudomonadota bacterium]
MKKGKVRSFGTFLGLSIITLGIYYFYWLYINLQEIKEAFTKDKNKRGIATVQKIFFAYLATSIVVMFVAYTVGLSQPGAPNPVIIPFLLLSTVVGAVFFYFYTTAIASAQSECQLTYFKVSNIYKYCIIGLITAFIGNFIPFLGLLGAIFMFVYIYRIQQEINRIWIEGKI